MDGKHRQMISSNLTSASELSIEDGCILWGSLVVVPPPGRAPVIKMLHEGHSRVSRRESLASSVMWWPRLDAELKQR